MAFLPAFFFRAAGGGAASTAASRARRNAFRRAILVRKRVGADFVFRSGVVAVLHPRQLFEFIVGPLLYLIVHVVSFAASFAISFKK